jgi:hypothetical protein
VVIFLPIDLWEDAENHYKFLIRAIITIPKMLLVNIWEFFPIKHSQIDQKVLIRYGIGWIDIIRLTKERLFRSMLNQKFLIQSQPTNQLH